MVNKQERAHNRLKFSLDSEEYISDGFSYQKTGKEAIKAMRLERRHQYVVHQCCSLNDFLEEC